MTATATTTTTSAAAAAARLLAVLDPSALPSRFIRGVGRRVIEFVEREDFSVGEIRLCQRPAGASQALTGERDQAGRLDSCAGCSRLCRGRTDADSPSARRGDRLGVTAAPAAPSTPTADAGPFGQLVRHFGHRQIRVAIGDPPARPRALLDPSQLDDVGEQVGHLDEVGAGVAAEADDLDPDALLLDGADGRREVAVAGHHDSDVEVAGRLHHVDDQLDIEVRLDLAVAVLADVLADDLVVAPSQEVVEIALVLVVRVEARVRIGAHEIATGRGRLEERDVIDVHARGLGRIEDVRYVHEDGDVLAHSDSFVQGVARPAR